MIHALVALLLLLPWSSLAYSNGPPKICWHCKSMKTGHGQSFASDRDFPVTFRTISPYNYGGDKSGHFSLVANTATYFKGISVQFRDSQNKPVGEFSIPENTSGLKYVDCRDCYKTNLLSRHMSERSCITHRSAEKKRSVEFFWGNSFGYRGRVNVFVTVVKSYGEFWEAKKVGSFEVYK